MSQDNIDKTAAEKAHELVDDTVEKVTVAKEWLDDLETRLARAERPVLVKVKDAVVTHKRQLVIAGVTVATLSAAAYVASHKDLLLEAVEETSETAELGAQGVKKTARKARTGSTTK